MESQGGQGPADFTHKLGIALKGAGETGCWLKKLAAGGRISEEGCLSMYDDNMKIVWLLSAVAISKKRNLKNEDNSKY